MKTPRQRYKSHSSNILNALLSSEKGIIYKNGHINSVVVFMLLVMLAYPLNSFAIDTSDQIKALFLGRFPSFVKWPSSDVSFQNNKNFILCILGKNPFGNVLDQIYSDRDILNKPVEIRYLDHYVDIVHCNVLFISDSKRRQLNKIIALTKKRPILTIGDGRGFSQRGVLIKFYQVRRKIRFEVNQQALSESGLTMSSKLLKLAKIVNPLK